MNKKNLYLIGGNKCPPHFGKDPYQIGGDTYFPQSGTSLFLQYNPIGVPYGPNFLTGVKS